MSEWEIQWGNPIRIGDIAEVHHQKDGKHTQYALLIAAAPKLLAFAREFLSDYQAEDGLASMKYYADKAHAAIAESTGGKA